jgi:hypothetical protein
MSENPAQPSRETSSADIQIWLKGLFRFFLILAVCLGVYYFRTEHDTIKKVIIYFVKHIGYSLLICLAVGCLLLLINSLSDESKRYKGYLYNAWQLAGSVPILREFLKIGPILVDPGRLLKQSAERNAAVLGAIIFAVLTINLANPILSALKLPPAKPTAAYTVFLADQLYKEKALETKKRPVEAFPVLGYIITNYSLAETKIDHTFTKVFLDRMDENPQLEYMSEFLCDGLSFFQIILERKLNVRDADQLKQLVKDDAPQHVKDALNGAFETFKETSYLEKLKENFIEIPIMLLIGVYFGFLISKTKKNYGQAITVSAYMFTATHLFHIIFFASLSLVNYLFLASFFIFILDIIYLQIWLIWFIPSILCVSRWRSFVFGNLGYFSVQVVSFFALNSYLELGIV